MKSSSLGPEVQGAGGKEGDLENKHRALQCSAERRDLGGGTGKNGWEMRKGDLALPPLTKSSCPPRQSEDHFHQKDNRCQSPALWRSSLTSQGSENE